MTYFPRESPEFNQFSDNTNLSLNVADVAEQQYLAVDLVLTQGSLNSSYRVVLTSSPTGTSTPGSDVLQVDSDNPLTTVDVSVQQSGSTLQILLEGSGPGNVVEVIWQIDRTIPRP